MTIRTMNECKLNYIDISPVISPKIAVYPGDVPFTRNVSHAFVKGDPLLLSSLQTTLHVGAHADAPSHYHTNGGDIAGRDLHYYLGLCQIISVKIPRAERILPEHVKDIAIKAPRVLFKTGSFPDSSKWNQDYNSLSPELLHRLADQGVILAGIDTPSVDPDDSKNLESHQALYERKMANLEGLALQHVADGLYTLIALPLRIKDADASPVRAILLTQGS